MNTSSIILAAIAVSTFSCVSHVSAAPAESSAITTATESPLNLKNLSPQQRQAAAAELAELGITPDYSYNLAKEEAAMEGDAELLRKLLIAAADENGVNAHLETTLLFAVINNHADCVKLLLQAGANARFIDGLGKTYVYMATENNAVECLKLLIAAGADLNEKAADGNAPLHIAILEEYSECLYLLLNNGAKPNVKNKDSETPLHLAVQRKAPLSTLELLLTHGADTTVFDAVGFTPLDYCIFNDSAEQLRFFLNAGASIETRNAYNDTLLHTAAARSTECTKILIAAGANTKAGNHRGDTPLDIAAEALNEDTLKTLLAAGANPNACLEDSTYLPTIYRTLRPRRDNPTCLKLIIDAGADVNVAASHTGLTPLHKAAALDLPECVKVLLNAGANPHSKNQKGLRPDQVASPRCGELIRAFNTNND